MKMPFGLSGFWISVAVLLALPFPVYAAETASASNAGSLLEYMEDYEGDYIYDEDLFSILDDYYSGSGTATSSDAILSDINNNVVSILAAVSPDDADDTEDDLETAPDLPEVSALALPDFSLDRNVVIYEGTWKGSACRLVFPAAYKQYIFIAEDGGLYNVSGSNISGRIFYGDYDTSSYTQYVYTCTSTVGNNASTLYNYGYPSYVTSYYESSGRLVSGSGYGIFYADRVIDTNRDSDDALSNYLLVCILFLLGVFNVISVRNLNRH